MTEIEERAHSMADWLSRRIPILKYYNITKMFGDMLNEQRAIDIDKACECFELAEDWQVWANGDFNYAKEYFRKVMEE